MHYESIENELNIDGGKHVLAMFLKKELLWMNNKTILNLAFVSHEELWRSSRVLSATADNTLLDLRNSS